MRRIIHVDMDQFFAAVEQRDNPSLRGLPVAVGHDGPRGVVSTASYEARRYGVHSAQSIQMAKRLCPQLVIVHPRFEAYKEVSMQIREIMHDYTDLIEPLSLDEAFLDVTENKKGITLAVDIAREIKQRILDTTQLTASAGVSYCKFLAKIASDWRKPNGLTVVHPDRAQEFIDHLHVNRIWGVGRKTAEHMHRMGIFTGYDLRMTSEQHLVSEFGKMGHVFYQFARGIDERPVVSQWERKSVSCEQTFEEDIFKPSAATIELYHTVLELLRRLEKSGFEGHTLTLKLKLGDFSRDDASQQDTAAEVRRDFSSYRQISRSITADRVLRSKEDILPLAKQLLSQVPFDEQHPIRLIGLGVSRSAADEQDDSPIDSPKQEWLELELQFEPWE
ncbi:DNA polymerase IV [Prevotella sp. E9-3]|uniref:DNA polymerase IV n=1 Tax=Prevotella sp. E9-3 TaxID=2913621 RepID=UPI001EDB7A63|nr:DNA polymerase IV [Prevotella sp. E9-3]UKK48527.1 DNA polymerase IV [Prevotella sp. E9-3]